MNDTHIYALLEGDVAGFLGVATHDLPQDIRILIKEYNFCYRALTREERDQAMLMILNRLHSRDLHIPGIGRKERWIRDWSENLDRFIMSGFDESELVPKYFQPNHVVRLRGDYIMPLNAHFERDFFRIIRRWLYKTYLAQEGPIYEFGCGSGANLVELAKLYPEKELHGLDWVEVSKEILGILAEKKGYRIKGHVFDMFFPNKSFPLQEGAAILAINSLEQLGDKFEPFLQFVLSKRPSLFVHVDSFVELYDCAKLPDYLTLMHNRMRNYLTGYLTRIGELEKSGVIEIVNLRHFPCGGLYHDYYSFLVWRMRGV